MVGTADSIRKEINAVEAATEKMAEELQELYQNYLEVLGSATKRQLILAGFQLCTQAYPEAFLKLTVSQREQLQQQLQQLGEEGRQRLLSLLEAPEETQPSIDDLPPALMAALERGALDADKSEDEEAAEESTDSPESKVSVDSNSEALMLEEVESEAAQDTSAAGDADAPEPEPMVKAMLISAVMEAIEANRAAEGDALTPSRLAQRYMLIERRIRRILQELSKSANSTLQQAKVLPNLPDAVLAAAAEAEMPLEKAGSPNMLNVLIEMGSVQAADEAEAADDEEDGDEEGSNDSPRAMAHLVALNLRLADIEFADTRLSMHRNQIRQRLAKLKKMASRYQKKRRELSVAEAEAAWRSVWYDENS